MIQATINGKTTHTISEKTINGIDYEWDILHVGGNDFHIIKDNISYNATVVSVNQEEKTMQISINGTDYEVSIKDKYDLLLQQMGISVGSAAQINKFKAPMPGLIREIMTAEGAEVQKGDILLILEAMKMENALKSPRDGKIKKVHAVTGNAVEKGQVLIEFE